MSFPLQFWDFDIWLAAIGIMLFLTSEMLSPPYEKGGIYINNKRLRTAATAVIVLFLTTVGIRIIGAVLTE